MGSLGNGQRQGHGRSSDITMETSTLGPGLRRRRVSKGVQWVKAGGSGECFNGKHSFSVVSFLVTSLSVQKS